MREKHLDISFTMVYLVYSVPKVCEHFSVSATVQGRAQMISVVKCPTVTLLAEAATLAAVPDNKQEFYLPRLPRQT
jgi:hypothetical protein